MNKGAVVSVDNIIIRENTLGLSNPEALFLLGAILTVYSEDFSALRDRLSDEVRLAVDSIDQAELLEKLGIEKKDYDAFVELV